MADEKKEDAGGTEPAKPDASLDGQFEIVVSPDKIQADLKIIPPKPGGKFVTSDAVQKSVSDMGLKDVHFNDVLAYLAEGNFAQPLIIARGAAPVAGQDGRVDYLYLEKGAAKVDQYGRLDHRSASAFKFAAKGEKLVKNYPPVEGKDGCTVFGDAIAHTPGKNLAPTAGKNIEVSPDGTEYMATDAGLVAMAGNQINVDRVLKTEGDVDFKVGNINFDGAVIITGAILEGFTVKSTGDVTAGLVSHGTVEAGGNVVIEKGILGREGTFVKAHGNVTAKFIENATVQADGSVLVSETIMHSHITAGKHVVVRGGKHCNIVGGVIQVGGSVEAHTIGAEVTTKTVIEVGYDPELRNRIQYLESELAKQSENRERVRQGAATLNKLKTQLKKLPPDKDALLKKLTETSHTLDQEIQAFDKEHADLQNQLQHAKPGTISGKDAIMPGTTATIFNETAKIGKKYSSTTIYLDREQKKIAFGSFTELTL